MVFNNILLCIIYYFISCGQIKEIKLQNIIIGTFLVILNFLAKLFIYCIINPIFVSAIINIRDLILYFALHNICTIIVHERPRYTAYIN